MITYKSKVRAISDRQRRAVVAALQSVGDYGVEHMRRVIPPDYYTGGDYATGNLVANIVRSRVSGNQHGHSIRYGVTPAANYALYWELGFWKLPAYRRRDGRWITVNDRSRAVWRRREIWVPEFVKIQPVMGRIFMHVYRQQMGTNKRRRRKT